MTKAIIGIDRRILVLLKISLLFFTDQATFFTAPIGANDADATFIAAQDSVFVNSIVGSFFLLAIKFRRYF